MGASECNDSFRRVIMRNVQTIHLHGTMQEQVAGKPCLFHRSAEACPMLQCDLVVMGPPCQPFSDQRAKRYRDGSAVQHPLASVTFRDAHNMIVQGGHRSLVMEQVAGFDKPESTHRGETPMKRRVISFGKFCSNFGCWLWTLKRCHLHLH